MTLIGFANPNNFDHQELLLKFGGVEGDDNGHAIANVERDRGYALANIESTERNLSLS